LFYVLLQLLVVAAIILSFKFYCMFYCMFYFTCDRSLTGTYSIVFTRRRSSSAGSTFSYVLIANSTASPSLILLQSSVATARNNGLPLVRFPDGYTPTTSSFVPTYNDELITCKEFHRKKTTSIRGY